jgi:hypothetical protein
VVKGQDFMNKLIILSLACIGFLVPMPVAANAPDPQQIDRNFRGGSNLLIAQYRGRQERRYYVYYRSPNGRIVAWILDGFHVDRRDAERAARRLERRGYRTDIRERTEAEHHGGGWSRNRDRDR